MDIFLNPRNSIPWETIIHIFQIVQNENFSRITEFRQTSYDFNVSIGSERPMNVYELPPDADIVLTRLLLYIKDRSGTYYRCKSQYILQLNPEKTKKKFPRNKL